MRGPNERVRPDEFEKAVIAETKSFREFAAREGVAGRDAMSRALETRQHGAGDHRDVDGADA